jgi:hypothetical protein
MLLNTENVLKEDECGTRLYYVYSLHPFASSHSGLNYKNSGLIFFLISHNSIPYPVFLQGKDNIVVQNSVVHNPQGICFYYF